MVITNLEEKENRKIWVPIRGGNRGGWTLFEWQKVRQMPYRDRQMYLGNSAKIGVLDKGGKWRKKDWYLKKDEHYIGDQLERARSEIIRKDQQRINKALGYGEKDDNETLTPAQMQILLKKIKGDKEESYVVQESAAVGLGFDKLKVQIRAKPTIKIDNPHRLQGTIPEEKQVQRQKHKEKVNQDQKQKHQRKHKKEKKQKKEKKEKKQKKEKKEKKEKRERSRSRQKADEQENKSQKKRSRSLENSAKKQNPKPEQKQKFSDEKDKVKNIHRQRSDSHDRKHHNRHKDQRHRRRQRSSSSESVVKKHHRRQRSSSYERKDRRRQRSSSYEAKKRHQDHNKRKQ